MAVSYVVDNLITDLGVICSRPNVDLMYSDAEICEIFDRVLKSKIVPLLMSVREEYFVTYADYTVAAGDTTGVAIPTDAIGMKLRQVAVVSTTQPTNVVTIPRLLLEQVNGQFPNQFVPQGYYIQDNNVIVFPAPTADITLRLYYLKRPLKLAISTDTTLCAQITSFPSANVAQFTTVDTSWSSLTSFSSVIQTPPFKSQTVTATNVDTALDRITLSVTYASLGLSVGDWICLSGYTPIPQVPIELFELLTQGSSCEYQKALGDGEAYQQLKVDYEQIKQDALTVINQRVEGVNKKITSNGNGLADWCGIPGRRWI